MSAVAEQVVAGTWRLRLPVPFMDEGVNAWLLDGDVPVLVDAGPALPECFEALERGLAAAGRRIEDLHAVVVTHHHLDHAGAAGLVADRAGAEVHAYGAAAALLADPAARLAAEQAFSAQLLRRHGAPHWLTELQATASAAMEPWVVPVGVDRRLADGDELTFGERVLRVHHRPGHSASDLVLQDDAAGLVLVGDHVLPGSPCTPFLSAPLPGQPQEPRALQALVASLVRTRELVADLALPGHGPAFAAHTAVIDRRLRHIGRRIERIEGALDPGTDMTAWDLTVAAAGGEPAPLQAYLALCWTLGALGVLVAEGAAVVSSTDDDRSVFRAALAAAA